jgi:hypothetical protein
MTVRAVILDKVLYVILRAKPEGSLVQEILRRPDTSGLLQDDKKIVQDDKNL